MEEVVYFGPFVAWGVNTMGKVGEEGGERRVG